MKLPILKRDLVHTLYRNVDRNIECYRSSDFSSLFQGEVYKAQYYEVPDVTFTEENLKSLQVATKGAMDVENAIIVHQELGHLAPQLASDERVWVALSHLVSPKFIWDRHIKTQNLDGEKLVQSIQSKFFARSGSRAFIRDNGLSRLWWIAHVATKNRPDIPPSDAIQQFAGLSDLRSTIIERPTTSRIPQVFAAIMHCYQRKIGEDPETTFFRRSKGTGQYRDWMKLINNLGGTKYYAVMEESKLKDLFWSLLKEIEQSPSES